MKNILFAFLFCLLAAPCISQTNIYNASTIPEALKENAHSVKREEKINFEVKDIDYARLSVHQVFTVLDAEAEDVLFFMQPSDEFRKLEDAEVKVFSANGKEMNGNFHMANQSHTF